VAIGRRFKTNLHRHRLTLLDWEKGNFYRLKSHNSQKDFYYVI